MAPPPHTCTKCVACRIGCLSPEIRDVISWLRRQAQGPQHPSLSDYADAIERGEHRRRSSPPNSEDITPRRE
jgi:hypothetical protein